MKIVIIGFCLVVGLVMWATTHPAETATGEPVVVFDCRAKPKLCRGQFRTYDGDQDIDDIIGVAGLGG